MTTKQNPLEREFLQAHVATVRALLKDSPIEEDPSELRLAALPLDAPTRPL